LTESELLSSEISKEEVESFIDELRTGKGFKVGQNWRMRIYLYDRKADFMRLQHSDELEENKRRLSIELAHIEQLFDISHIAAFHLRSSLAAVLEELEDYRGAKKLYEVLIQDTDSAPGYGPLHPTAVYLRCHLAGLHLCLGEFDAADKCATAAHNHCLQSSWIGVSHTLRAMVLGTIGNIATKKGEWGRSEKSLKAALKINREFYGKAHPVTIRGRADLAGLYYDRRDVKKFESMARQVHMSAKELLGSDHVDTIEYATRYAMALEIQAKYSTAESLLQEIIQIAESKLGPDHPNTLNSKYTLGLVYYSSGRCDEAKELQEFVTKAREKSKQERGIDYADTASMSNLALVYLDLNMNQQAHDILKKVELIWRHSQKIQTPDALLGRINLAAALYNLEEFDEAQKMLVECIADCRRRLGNWNWITLLALHNLADVLSAQDLLEDEVRIRREVVVGHTTLYGKNHYETLASMSELASSLAEEHQLDEAMEIQEKALRLCKRHLEPLSAVTVDAMRNLASMYALNGQLEKAISLQKIVISSTRKTKGDNDDTVSDVYTLALLLIRQGNINDALNLHTQIMERLAAKPLDDQRNSLLLLLDINLRNPEQYMRGQAESFLNQIMGCLEQVGIEDEDVLTAEEKVAVAYSDIGEHTKALEILQDIVERSNALLPTVHVDRLRRLASLVAVLGFLGRFQEAVTIGTELLATCETAFGEEHEETILAAATLALEYALQDEWKHVEELAEKYINAVPDNLQEIDSAFRVKVALLAAQSANPKYWDPAMESSGYSELWELVYQDYRKGLVVNA
jgi:tetratricopeptide (TPR) repeat protein